MSVYLKPQLYTVLSQIKLQTFFIFIKQILIKTGEISITLLKLLTTIRRNKMKRKTNNPKLEINRKLNREKIKNTTAMMIQMSSE